MKVNGTNAVGEICDDVADVTNGNQRFSYSEADGTLFEIPNQEYYDQLYSPRFTRIDKSLADNLYKSQCLEDLSRTDDINDQDLPEFQYNDILLYNLATDPIEACAILDNDAKKQELLDILDERSREYDAPQLVTGVLGSLKAQMESYDCNFVYTKPWNGDDDGDLDQIWLDFIERQMECNEVASNPAGYKDKIYDHNQYKYTSTSNNSRFNLFFGLNELQIAGFVIGIFFGLLLVVVLLWYCRRGRVLKHESK